VVASAVMRQLFPQDVARRAFLKTLGASTAFRRAVAILPLKMATEVFAAGGRLKRRISRSASSRSPARRRSSWQSPWTSNEKHGLNVDVIKTQAGR